ncbi:MAG: hypothetical protein P8X75_04220 [Limibacillus sp.]|jgi:hypothetical protein
MEQNSSILERKGEGEGHAERKAIVATFWESESDAEGLHHYAGPLDLREGGMADAEGAEYVEMWMLLCRRINLLEHDRRVVSLLDAWSFMPYFVATSDDPEVAHWLALLDALQNKLPLRACQTCGDLFQPGEQRRQVSCPGGCREPAPQEKRRGAINREIRARPAARPGFSSRQLHSKSEL